MLACRSEVLPAADSALRCFFPSKSYYVEDAKLKDQVGVVILQYSTCTGRIVNYR